MTPDECLAYDFFLFLYRPPQGVTHLEVTDNGANFWSITEPDDGTGEVWLGGKWMASTFETGCRCEHDCCGHYQTYAVADLYGRRVVVTTHSYRNL